MKKLILIIFLLLVTSFKAFAVKSLLYEIKPRIVKQRILQRYSTRELLEELEHRKLEVDFIHTIGKTYWTFTVY